MEGREKEAGSQMAVTHGRSSVAWGTNVVGEAVVGR